MKVNCTHCTTQFDRKPNQVKRSKNQFCCQAHAASYNNKRRAPRRPPKNCLNCLTTLIGKNSIQKFCSNKCQMDYQYRVYIERWLLRKESGYSGSKRTLRVSGHVRKWLIETRGEKCEECTWQKRNSITNKVPLDVHHTDGNAENNVLENLKLLCPNCHSLTTTYCGLNRGNGRLSNRQAP